MQVVLVIAEQQRTRNAKFETREDGPTKRNSKTQPQKTRVGHPICKMPVSPRSRESGQAGFAENRSVVVGHLRHVVMMRVLWGWLCGVAEGV